MSAPHPKRTYGPSASSDLSRRRPLTRSGFSPPPGPRPSPPRLTASARSPRGGPRRPARRPWSSSPRPRRPCGPSSGRGRGRRPGGFLLAIVCITIAFPLNRIRSPLRARSNFMVIVKNKTLVKNQFRT